MSRLNAWMALTVFVILMLTCAVVGIVVVAGITDSR